MTTKKITTPLHENVIHLDYRIKLSSTEPDTSTDFPKIYWSWVVYYASNGDSDLVKKSLARPVGSGSHDCYGHYFLNREKALLSAKFFIDCLDD